jgi:MFS family permease
MKGNARALVFTEPFFSIPYIMFSGYMTLYMRELGVTKAQIGMITSLGLMAHFVFAFMSAYITDRYGRRNTTLVFDTLGWCGSIFIWAISKNIHYFIVAAIFNAITRIVMNSFHCLMLEDSPPDTRIHIFTFLQFASILAGLFTPLGALMISKMTLIPAMRLMLFSCAAIFLALFVVRNFFLTETEIGKKKMEEMKGLGFIDVLKSYVPVMKRVIANRLLVITLVIRALNFIQFTVRGTFLALLVRERLGFPAEAMAVFNTLNSVVMLLVLLFASPYLARFTRRWPLMLGTCFHIAASFVLLLSPPTQNYFLLAAAAILIALGSSIIAPRMDTLVANTIENEDRSVVNAVIDIILLMLSVPFGFFGGVLSEIDPRLPFLMILILYLISFTMLHISNNMEKKMLQSL